MFGFLKRLPSPPSPPDPQAWQRRWHEILDGCDHPEGDGKGVPEPLPDMMDDLRLHFGFWHPDWAEAAAARRQAFAILPHGAAMLARVETVLAPPPPRALRAEDAEAVLRQGLVRTRALGMEVPDPDGAVRVLGMAQVTLLQAFAEAETPFMDLRDQMPDLARAATGAAGEAAYVFLSEPLYRLAATHDISAWVRWPLCAQPRAADPTEAAYRLYRGGWSAGWDGEGLFLYDRRAAFGLT